MDDGKCYLCGSTNNLINVECKYHYIRSLCPSCIRERLSRVSEHDKLKAMIDGILNSLSDCQRGQAESYANFEIEKIAFSDVYIEKQ